MSAALAPPVSPLRHPMKEFVFAETIHLPPSFTDLESFRTWCRSEAYPERGDVFWIDGVIWVDTHMDELDFHNAVKTEFVRVLSSIVKTDRLGYLYSDRARLVHPRANLSVEPDAIYFTKGSLESERVRRISAADSGTREIEGAADMVLEIVSAGSEKKDTVTLREKYWAAGITEYWLVDVRKDSLRFEILRRGPRGFVTTRKVDGWLRSMVFNRRFQLSMELDENGIPEYTLAATSTV
jgi:Uma2 family endonuclease